MLKQVGKMLRLSETLLFMFTNRSSCMQFTNLVYGLELKLSSVILTFLLYFNGLKF